MHLKTNTVQLFGNEEIWYTDVSKNGKLAEAVVHRRTAGKGVIIHLNSKMQAELISIFNRWSGCYAKEK